MEIIKAFDWNIFIILALPGFISMKAYGLIHPIESKTFKDNLLEAIFFGVLNAILLSPLIIWLYLITNSFQSINYFCLYAIIVLALVVAPIFWAFLLNKGLTKLSQNGSILSRYRTAWDHYFSEEESCWVILHLNDGRKIGGLFGINSYASSFPDSGHVYLEQVWTLDENGSFISVVPDSNGIIVTPTEYGIIEFFKTKEKIEKKIVEGQNE